MVVTPNYTTILLKQAIWLDTDDVINILLVVKFRIFCKQKWKQRNRYRTGVTTTLIYIEKAQQVDKYEKNRFASVNDKDVDNILRLAFKVNKDMYKTNRLDFAVHMYCNRSQMMS